MNTPTNSEGVTLMDEAIAGGHRPRPRPWLYRVGHRLGLMYGLYRSWDNTRAVAAIKAIAGVALKRSMWTNPNRLWPFPKARRTK